MDDALYDRFTGLTHAREGMRKRLGALGVERVAIVAPGKNDWAVRQALDEIGIKVVQRWGNEQALVIGTLSPGPILDALETERAGAEQLPIVVPWEWEPGSPQRRRVRRGG
jgi:hypothetical protein